MAIYHWRDRNSSPSLALLEAVCSAFGITLLNFLMDEDDMAENKELLKLWYSLTPEQRKNILNLMKSMK